MATDEPDGETTVSDRGMVTIPADVRRRLDIDAGDKLRWEVDEEGNLGVEIVRQRYGAFDDAPTAELGGDSLETHDHAGYERDTEEDA